MIHTPSLMQRCEILARYVVDNRVTVRDAAKHYSISKSTVHKDITERLKLVNPTLYAEAGQVLQQNKAERHIRGGEATRRKYLQEHGAAEKQAAEWPKTRKKSRRAKSNK